MKQTTLVRELVIDELHRLRARISQLPEFESEALASLGGVPFQNAETFAELVGRVLEHLGHPASEAKRPAHDKTLRAVNKSNPKVRAQHGNGQR